eukprot:TRINITY_DN116103_c0_g1_i1.p1 TRINITY_DN116103_c0_g1~~TRINITY_DN116103_c0_g1_i1.p1  ORF type:complete len:376 (-),score=102.47 TRINITY_DN116103_c0_g1_i1:30-1157(-)
MARSPRRSRSRSKGGRDGRGRDHRNGGGRSDRDSGRDNRNSSGGGRDRRDRDRSRDRGGARRGSPPRHSQQDRKQQERGGRDNDRPKTDDPNTPKAKAKAAMEKEKEKARLKKLEREEAQKAKEHQKKENQDKKREANEQAILSTVSENAAQVADEKRNAKGGNVRIARQSTNEMKQEAAKAMSAAERAAEAAKSMEAGLHKRAAKAKSDAFDEKSARKLFDMLDRSGKEQVSQRDVLMALRKQHALRQLFGIAGKSMDDGGTALQERLVAIQDAFESGSGLGELNDTFSELKAGGEGQTFGWPSFLAALISGSLKDRALLAFSSLPREHSTGAAFVPSHEWKVVPKGAACPGGLEYKMDMETGQTLGRIPRTKG